MLGEENDYKSLIKSICEIDLKCFEIFSTNLIKKIDSVDQKNYGIIFDVQVEMREIAQFAPVFVDYSCSSIQYY